MLRAECGFPDQAMHLAQFGPTLEVRIGFDPGYRAKSGDIPGLSPKEYNALIDTGAAESCIDSQVAAPLGMPVVDEMPVSGVHGQAVVNVHLGQIHAPALGFTIYGRFCGVHLHAGGQPHSALLGRTFLYHTTMTYQGKTGSVTLSRQTRPDSSLT